MADTKKIEIREVLRLDPATIRVGHTGRSAVTDVDDLASDMADNGQMQPIGTRTKDGEMWLVWGSRRLAAALLINEAGLGGDKPFLVDCLDAQGAKSEAEYFERTLVENLARENTTALDDAHNIEELITVHNRTPAYIAELYGKSKSWVSHRRSLLKLPPELQEAVHAGKLPSLAAYELTKASHKGQAQIIAKLAKGEEITNEQAAKAAAAKKKKEAGAPKAAGRQVKESRAKTLKQVKVYLTGLSSYEDASKDPDGWIADLGASFVKWVDGKMSDAAMTRKLMAWGAIEPAPASASPEAELAKKAGLVKAKAKPKEKKAAAKTTKAKAADAPASKEESGEKDGEKVA